MVLKYEIKAKSIAKAEGVITAKNSAIEFGITSATADILPTPAELLLSAFASCILKNIERFSTILKFEYSSAEIIVCGDRQERPPRMDNISYDVKLYSNDSRLNVELLHRNIKKQGTIYNTIAMACAITGKIDVVRNV